MLEMADEDRFAIGSGRVERSESAEFVKRRKEVVNLLRILFEVVEFSLAGTPYGIRVRVRLAVVLIVDTESSVGFILLV